MERSRRGHLDQGLLRIQGGGSTRFLLLARLLWRFLCRLRPPNPCARRSSRRVGCEGGFSIGWGATLGVFEGLWLPCRPGGGLEQRRDWEAIAPPAGHRDSRVKLRAGEEDSVGCYACVGVAPPRGWPRSPRAVEQKRDPVEHHTAGSTPAAAATFSQAQGMDLRQPHRAATRKQEPEPGQPAGFRPRATARSLLSATGGSQQGVRATRGI